MYYFITLKKNKVEYTSIAEIEQMYKCLFGHLLTLSFAIELDSLYRLHSHSITRFKNVPWYERFQTNGWRVHLCPIKLHNIDRTDRYIHKNQSSCYVNEMEWTSRSYHEYLFI